MLNKRNSLWTAFDLFDDIIDDVEVHVVDRFAMRYEEMKDDLQKVVERTRQNSSSMDRIDYLGLLKQLQQPPLLLSDRELQKRREIRSFELALCSDSARSSFLARLNASIRQTTKSAKEFLAYCESQPELKELTVTKELTRMNYTLYTPEGTKITDPQEIAHFIQTESPEMANRHELVYRAANQTIFADMITSLTSFDGLIRPQLSAGTFVDDSSIVIDLASDHPHVRAECFLNICIPDGINGKLGMAGAIAEIVFCPTKEEMKAELLYLTPCNELTEQQVIDAAKSLAELSS
jgi:hypothetical protein